MKDRASRSRRHRSFRVIENASPVSHEFAMIALRLPSYFRRRMLVAICRYYFIVLDNHRCSDKSLQLRLCTRRQISQPKKIETRVRPIYPLTSVNRYQ
jgi:hypothetical protein